MKWEEFQSEDYEHDFSTVEHIYPQKPKDAYWHKHFKALDVKQKNILRQSLGNLLPLSRPKNSALGNLPFPAKRDGTKETHGYKYGSYSEIEVAQLEDWTPETILERGVRILSFMERRWKINIGDNSVKAHLLGLDFLLPKTPSIDDPAPPLPHAPTVLEGEEDIPDSSGRVVSLPKSATRRKKTPPASSS